MYQLSELDEKRFLGTLSAFVNNGRVADEYIEALNTDEDGKVVTDTLVRDKDLGIVRVKDLISTETATRFIPKVISTIIREAIEPRMVVVPNIFQEIRLQAGRSIELGSIGSMYASDIAEGAEYPERQPDMDGGDQVSISVKKSGIMVKITDEMIADSQWDVITLWLNQAGKALARHKELKAMKLLNTMGTLVFDNVTPANAQKGITTGRGIDGAPNGSLSLRDLFDLAASLILTGFVPNTLLIHPFSWAVFATDPIMSEIVQAWGSVTALPSGNQSPGFGTGHGGLGLTTAGQQPFTATWNTKAASNKFPVPLQVIVTPFVPFDASAQTCSVILADRDSTGVLVTRDPVTTERFDIPARDMSALKIMERYGFALWNQGKGVAVAANVSIAPHYGFNNVNAHALGPIDQSVPLAAQGGGVNPPGAYLGT